MTVEFLQSFSRDTDKSLRRSDKLKLLKLITQIENANDLSGIAQVKKLAGYRTAYRIRLGDYRIGFFFFRITK
jgi:mRNA interferase RelE/StbE